MMWGAVRLARRSSVAAVVVAACLLAAPMHVLATLPDDGPGAPGAPTMAAQPSCLHHPPIRITERVGPEGFEWVNPLNGRQEPRPGSGVTGGTGTPEDPYRIEGWCVLPVGGDEPFEDGDVALALLGITAHVQVRDNRFAGFALHPLGEFRDIRVFPGHGVVLRDVANVQLERNHFESLSSGVQVNTSHDVTLADNTMLNLYGTGIMVTGSADVAVLRNTVEDGDGDGIVVRDSGRILVNGNVVRGNDDTPIELREVTDSVVEGNVVEGTYWPIGIYVSRSERILVRGNDAGTPNNHAVRLFEVRDSRVEENVLRGGLAGAGLSLDRSHGNVVSANTNAEPWRDIWLHRSTDNLVEANRLVDGYISVNLDSADNVIRANHLSGRGCAIDLRSTSGNLVEDNLVEDCYYGVVVSSGASDNHIRGNRIEGSLRGGISFSYGATSNLVEDNILVGNKAGVSVEEGAHSNLVVRNTIRDGTAHGVDFLVFNSPDPGNHNTFLDNRIHGNPVGVRVNGEGNRFHGNDIFDNPGGGIVAVQPNATILATHNWWGCAEGPGRPGCDTVEGDVAYEPWRSASNPDAGARAAS